MGYHSVTRITLAQHITLTLTHHTHTHTHIPTHTYVLAYHSHALLRNGPSILMIQYITRHPFTKSHSLPHSFCSGSKLDQQLSDSEEMVTAIDDVTTEEETPEAPRPGNRRRMSVKSAEDDAELAETTPTMGVRHGRSNSETPPMQTKRPSHTESERNRRSRSIGEIIFMLSE